ncbi:MAG: hypothetical protein CMA70_01890 [Euryarchaeota archaeon]|nr:hypothetical protein [Euryarchaeota archaeon]
MSEVAGSWKPEALPQIEHSEIAPRGFEILEFSGRGPLSGLSCSMIQPSEMIEPSDWIEIVSELESWGEVPDPQSIVHVSTSDHVRGPIANLRSETEWVAEFLPWGTDGLLRKRVNSYPESCDLPCGGYSWNGSEVISIRKEVEQNPNSRELLLDAFEHGSMKDAEEILRDCGRGLGSVHAHVEETRVTPADPNRWNSRVSELEEALNAHSIWRAPYSSDSECMVCIGDVRLEDFRNGSVRISRPRLSDALYPPNCGFPAIRDLASLIHDLSRLHYASGTDFDIVGLRLSLIEGWRESAPRKWASDNVFYSHRGGLAIWEYEQCLLDVIEATSHQSGAPEPAVGLIAHVPSFQKKMFNNRTIGALSIMAGFFGITSIYRTFPPSSQEIVMPSLFIIVSAALMRTYRRMSPSPEIPFNLLD